MKKKIVVSVVLIALVAGATALVQHRKARNEATAPTAVSPVIVPARALHMGDVVLTRPAVAEVRALTEAVVASRFSGYVLEMPYPEGQKVKKGDVLARLDASQVEADVAKAQAELARSRQQESALSADLAAARATLDSETQRYRRLEELYKIKFVSLQQLQSGEATLAAAQARKAAADSAWNGYRDSLRAAESGLRAARENRRYAVLTAPFDGIVAGRLAQPGDLTSPGKPLYKLVAAGESRLLISLPEGLTPAGLRLNGQILELVPWPEATPQGMRRFEARARDLTPGSRVPVEVVVFRGRAVFLPDDCLLGGETDRATVLKPLQDKAQAVALRLAASGSEGAASTDAGLDGSRILCGSADALMRLAAGAPSQLAPGP